MQHSIWEWILFLTLIAFLIILDLGVLHKTNREISIKESFISSAVYIAIGLLFSVWIGYISGFEQSKEYLTGFTIEKALALDNIFVITIIFKFFAIPEKYQYRVLFWGIIGAIVSRAIMIAVGASLLAAFDWIHYVFAVFLLLTGVKMLIVINKEIDIKNSILLKIAKKYLKVTEKIHDDKFYITTLDQSGLKQMLLTPLGLALIMVEFIDVIFALDSVPAIFSITNDPYIVYTSNIFAILGLRSLYFALSSSIKKFYYLKFSLAFVLIFIGSKSFLAYFLGLEKFPINISLIVTLGLIAGGILYSVFNPKPRLNS